MTTYRTWDNEHKEWIPTADAWAFYDGGWRGGDAAEMMEQLEDVDEEEAAEICAAMQLCSDIIEQEKKED